jgi:fucose permease
MNDAHRQFNIGRLLLIGNLSIFMIGLGFAVRANIASDLQTDIFDIIDVSNSAAMVGEALGITFTGFALTLLFGSALVDFIGMRAMLLLSATGYVLGSALVLAAAWLPVSDSSYWLVLAGLLLTGLGWGAVEAASNPLVATLYPEEKTHRLNVLHAWWPAGIVVGGLAGVAMGAMGLSWQLNLFILLVPAIVMAVLVMGTEFPVTERVASGVSYSDMFSELKRQPMFFLWLVCMFMTASAELAPGQWVDLALSRVVGMDGILLLVYISALMFVMRHFAGPIVDRISSVGLLWLSSILAVIGLYGLGRADSPATAFAAATIWGLGVCFMWPTMLANVSERFPRGGALFLGMIGFCGGMAIQFVLPQLGAIFDRAKIEAAGGVDQLAALSGPELDEVMRYASVESFSAVALIPLALIPIFGFIWWRDRRAA